MGNFCQSAKGGTLCEILEIGHFFGRTLLGWKMVNTSRVLAYIVWMNADFILVSIETTRIIVNIASFLN